MEWVSQASFMIYINRSIGKDEKGMLCSWAVLGIPSLATKSSWLSRAPGLTVGVLPWELSLVSAFPSSLAGNCLVFLCKRKDWVFMVGPALQSLGWSWLCFTSAILSLASVGHLQLDAKPNGDHLCFCPHRKTIAFIFYRKSFYSSGENGECGWDEVGWYSQNSCEV